MTRWEPSTRFWACELSMKGLLFTYLLTYGGAVLSLFNPFYGLLVYICFANLKPEDLWFWSVPAGNFSRIVAIAFLLGWIIHGCGNWDFGRAKPVVYALLAFWAWCIISAIFAPDSAAAWSYVEAKSKIFLPTIAGTTLLDSKEKVKQLAWAIALSQGYVAYDLNMTYFGGFNRMQFSGFGGMDNNSQAIAMVTGAGLSFFLGLTERRWGLRLLALASAALMVHTVMFAFSRGGMLALCVTAVISTYFICRQAKHLWALVLAAIVSVAMLGPEVTERFLSSFAEQEERDASAQSRVDMWIDCVDAMLKNPILGVGPAGWPAIATEYGWPPGKEAHTLWLQAGAELGIPGLFFLLSFYGICIFKLWRLWLNRNLAEPYYVEMGTMVIVSLLGFIVAAQFVSLVGLEIPYYVALVGIGTLILAGPEWGVDRVRSAESPSTNNGNQ